MIFTDRKITIRNGKSSIDAPVVLYRGDFEVSIRFTIMESKFRFKSGVNLVDSEKASFGQLAILAPYGGNVFSEIVKCEDGTVTFTLTKEMIDQLEEVGLYSFQIRLFDYYRESRVSIPPVEFGIEVREPVASEDHDNEVNNAIVGYSIAKVVDGLNEDVGPTFDDEGNYNKTDWKTGDRISEGKLNKIEDAIDTINQNEIADVADLNKRITSNFNVLSSEISSRSISVNQIDKNLGKLDETYMSDSFLQQIAGNSDIHAVPANWSITNEKLAKEIINRSHLNFDDPYRILDRMDYLPGFQDISLWKQGYVYGGNSKAYICKLNVDMIDTTNNTYILTFNDELYDVAVGCIGADNSVIADSSWKSTSYLNVNKYIYAKNATEFWVTIRNKDYTTLSIDDVFKADVNLALFHGNVLDDLTSVVEEKLAYIKRDMNLLEGRLTDDLSELELIDLVNPKTDWKLGTAWEIGSNLAHHIKLEVSDIDFTKNIIFTFNSDDYNLGIAMWSESNVVKDKGWYNTSPVYLDQEYYDSITKAKYMYVVFRNKGYSPLTDEDNIKAGVAMGYISASNHIEEIQSIKSNVTLNSMNINSIQNTIKGVFDEYTSYEYVNDVDNWQKGTSYEVHSKAFSVVLDCADIDTTRELAVIFNSDDYNIAINVRDADNTILSDQGWKSTSPYYLDSKYRTAMNNGDKCWITIRNKDYSVLTEADITKAIVQLVNITPGEYRELVNSVNSTTAVPTTQHIRQNNIKMVGHAGMDGYAPENTIPSFGYAVKYGFEFLECDLRSTSDGHFVLMHDTTVDRTTNGTGNVSDMTLDEIKSLTIDYGTNVELYPNLRVPTLEEFLQFCKSYDVTPVIEIRNENSNQVENFMNIIRRYGFEYSCIVISFYLDTLQLIRKLSSNIVLQPLIDLSISNIDYCANTLGVNTGIDTLYTHVTKELVEYAHSKGVLVNCWTVNDYNVVKTLDENGVDYITTNRSIYNNNIKDTENQIVRVNDGNADHSIDLSDIIINNDVVNVSLDLYVNSESVSLYIGGDSITFDEVGVWKHINIKAIARINNIVSISGTEYVYRNFKITIQHI